MKEEYRIYGDKSEEREYAKRFKEIKWNNREEVLERLSKEKEDKRRR